MLHLLIPSQSLAKALELGPDSALARLLSKAQCETLDISLEELICQQAGIARQPDSSVDTIPFAAISCLGDGSTPASLEAGISYLFADPVHLVLQRDSFSLSSPAPLTLSSSESEELLESLNQHFASDGLSFIQGTSGRWYLQQQSQPRIATSHPGLAINRDIHAFLPQGLDAGKWNHLINEIQMLLFSHPVNEMRESQGLLPCNSLWFWGGGKLPEAITAELGEVYSTMPLIKGLCRLAGLAHREVPADFPVINAETTLISFDAAHSLHDAWFQAAADALRRGDIQALQLYFALEGKVLSAHLRKRDLWKFWRKIHAPVKYFEA